MTLFRSTFMGKVSFTRLRRPLSNFCSLLSSTYSTSSAQVQQLEIKQDTKIKKAVLEKLIIPNPLHHPDFFNVKNLFTMEDLFNARVHYGHTTGTLDDNMQQFVLGHRLGTVIFDLDQTTELLKEALNFIAHIAFRQGIILFIGRYKQHSSLLEKTAIECGEYCHARFWFRGSFTNPKRYGIMTRLPDLTIFLNILDSTFELHQAVLESNKLLIPSVGIVDTNCFPNFITYPIPGNDDSPESAALYCKLFKTAILLGKQKRNEFVEKYGEDFEKHFVNVDGLHTS